MDDQPNADSYNINKYFCRVLNPDQGRFTYECASAGEYGSTAARMPRAQGCAGAVHMSFLNSVYVGRSDRSARLRWVSAIAPALKWYGV